MRSKRVGSKFHVLTFLFHTDDEEEDVPPPVSAPRRRFDDEEEEDVRPLQSLI